MTGCDDSDFEYIELPRVAASSLLGHAAALRKRSTALAMTWTPELNDEWIVRHFLALKLILSAGIMLDSLRHAERIRLKITQPYLAYYTLLTCCRALVLTVYEEKWREGDLASKTHGKTANIAVAQVAGLSPVLGTDLRALIDELRALRDTFSYGMPLGGLSGVLEQRYADARSRLKSTCQLVCELAQFNSECLETAITSAGVAPMTFRKELARAWAKREGKDKTVFDRDDWYRLGYFERKGPGRPISLFSTLTEGIVDDVMSGWSHEDVDDPLVFVPDAVQNAFGFSR